MPLLFDNEDRQNEDGCAQGLCGVGIRISDSQPYRVRELLEGGSAIQNGSIRVGDILLAVDGVEVSNLRLQEVRSMIFGDAGTLVHIRFRTRVVLPSPKPFPKIIHDLGLHANLSITPLKDFPGLAVPDLSISFDESDSLTEECFDVELVRQRLLIIGESPIKAKERRSWAGRQVLCRNLKRNSDEESYRFVC